MVDIEFRWWAYIPRLLLGFGTPTLELMRLAEEHKILEKINNSDYKCYIKRRRLWGLDDSISSSLEEANKDKLIVEGNPRAHIEEDKTGYFFISKKGRKILDGRLEKVDENIEDLAISAYPYGLYFYESKIDPKKISESLTHDMMVCLMLKVLTRKDEKNLLDTANYHKLKPIELYIGVAVYAIDSAVRKGLYKVLLLEKASLITPPYEEEFREHIASEKKK